MIAANPPYWTAPFLSPPAVALLWSPFAVIPGGMVLWYLGAWGALLGTVVTALRRGGPLAVSLCVLLAGAIAVASVMANLNAYLAAGTMLAWVKRRDDRVGALIGVMAALKLAPVVLGFWLLADRRWRALGWMAAAVLVVTGAAALATGFDTSVEYLSIAIGIPPSPESLSAMTGTGWIHYGVVVVGCAVTLVTRGWVSFSAAVIAMTLGSPAMYQSSLVMLLPVAVAAADDRGRPILRRRSGGGGQGQESRPCEAIA